MLPILPRTLHENPHFLFRQKFKPRAYLPDDPPGGVHRSGLQQVAADHAIPNRRPISKGKIKSGDRHRLMEKESAGREGHGVFCRGHDG